MPISTTIQSFLATAKSPVFLYGFALAAILSIIIVAILKATAWKQCSSSSSSSGPNGAAASAPSAPSAPAMPIAPGSVPAPSASGGGGGGGGAGPSGPSAPAAPAGPSSASPQALQASASIRLTSGADAQRVLDGGKPAVLLVWSPGCGYCMRAKPAFESAAAKSARELSVPFYAIDSGAAGQDFMKRHDIRGIPFIVGVHPSAGVIKFQKARNEAEFLAFAQSLLSAAGASASTSASTSDGAAAAQAPAPVPFSTGPSGPSGPSGSSGSPTPIAPTAVLSR